MIYLPVPIYDMLYLPIPPEEGLCYTCTDIYDIHNHAYIDLYIYIYIYMYT